MKKVLGAMSGIIFSVFCIAILGLLMSFTLGALKKIFPDSFVNQMWGLVLFDIAAMVWGLAFVFKSNSIGQYAAAGIGFVTGFLGTLLMVTFEVLTSGQTFVTDNGSLGRWAVYGFVVVTAIHAALVYFHHASAPDIHEKINVGIARGEITTEAIRQATNVLEVQKAQLAETIHREIVEQVKRDLNIPILADPRMPIIPAEEDAETWPLWMDGYTKGKQYQAEQTQAKPAGNSLWDNIKRKMKKPDGMVTNEQTVVDMPNLKEQAAPASQQAPKQEEPPAANDASFPQPEA
jgi:hypothetical protein